MASKADKTKPYIPLNSLQQDGWSKDTEATATCFCGTVQLALVGACCLYLISDLHLRTLKRSMLVLSCCQVTAACLFNSLLFALPYHYDYTKVLTAD